jgi:hypothetical protein
VSVAWTSFVDVLFDDPAEPSETSSVDQASPGAHPSLSQANVSVYFAIQPGASQNDANP